MAVFTKKKGILIYHYDAETVRIEPWGENAFRIRATKNAAFTDDDWALSMKTENIDAQIHIDEKTAFIKNGKIRAEITRAGKLTFYNGAGKVLLEEYLRNRKDVFADYCSALEIEAREFKPNIGGDYHL